MSEASKPGLADVIQNGAATLMPEVLAEKWPDLSWPSLKEEIDAKAAGIRAENKVPPADPQSEGLAELNSFMLAMYRVLWRATGDRLGAIDLCRHVATTAFKAGVMNHIEKRFKIDFHKPGEAFEQIAENFLQGGREVFGQKFIYQQETLTDDLNSVLIQRCYFNDYLRAYDAPELIPVFCACDNIWADEINKEKYGVTFHRPSLLSLGDDACRFQFRRR